MPPLSITLVKLAMPEDQLTPDDILQSLDTILVHGWGELRIVVQNHVILTISPTIHRRRANNRPTRATLR
jgi:hypothetical protein